MSSVRLTRCLLRLAACSFVTVVLSFGAVADAAPYVSCPGGYIAEKLADCPPFPKHPVIPRRGGGGPGGGLLGDLLGRVGLGGLF